ncbi:MAG: hypothetical protein QOJ70_920 [Acidobacteriota bacterium]|jgi:hypothetical protein|nr:hypothetical protein [Acidobacteriota bacterium]
MPYLFRPRLVVLAVALLFGAAFGAQSIAAQNIAVKQPVGPGEVLISEFRLSGPSGSTDEYIEFYCNRDTDCDISNYIIQGFDTDLGDYTITLEGSFVIPTRGHLLVGNSIGYSLSSYASLDADVSSGTDVFVDNQGFQLRDNTGMVVIDSVGFIDGGNNATYIEGTGLEQSFSRPADQYAYVRKMGTANGGRPQDTNNNANDFVLVSVTGAPHDGITAPPVLGAPGPQGLTSAADFNNSTTGSLVEPNADKSAPPNRVRTGSGDSGTLSIRRSVTNNTDQFINYLAFRVIDITTLNSPPVAGASPPQAQLRLVTSSDAETFTNSQGRTVVIRGTVLEFDDGCGCEPAQPDGGGLNTSVNVGNFGGLEPGATIDVQFLLNVVQAGTFRFYVNVEALTGRVMTDTVISAHTGSAPRRARLATSFSTVVARQLVVRKGVGASANGVPFSKSILKKALPVKPNVRVSEPPTKKVNETPARKDSSPKPFASVKRAAATAKSLSREVTPSSSATAQDQ